LALRRKVLLLREPLLPRAGEQVRHLIVTPQIDALLDGHVLRGVFPDTSAERLIGIFSAGHRVTVSREKTKAKPDVEQIVGADEVWALCARTPPPGWRILGRFFDKGDFIALRAWDKRELFANYSHAANEVIADWIELFGQLPPHRGSNVGDYL